MTASSKPHTPKHDLTALDALTGGAFTAATASDRATRLNQWLASQPEHEQLQAVFTEMSHRDKGAAKLVREKLDEARKAKDQDALMQEWATTGEALRDADRINLADAMAWQRDAAKAGAPLSREPLASLKTLWANASKPLKNCNTKRKCSAKWPCCWRSASRYCLPNHGKTPWPSAKAFKPT